MAKTTFKFRIDASVKKDAELLSKQLGIPLSTIVDTGLRQFIAERRIELRA